MSNEDLDAFLASDENGEGARFGQKRCATCRHHGHLDPLIQEFYRRKREGEIHLPTFSQVGSKSLWAFLRTQGYDLANSTLVRHVTLCLGIDHKTGRPL